MTGTPHGGLVPGPVSDPSHCFGGEPSIDLEKHMLGQDADTPPSPSMSRKRHSDLDYRVANTGNVTLMDITFVDSEKMAVTCPMGPCP